MKGLRRGLDYIALGLTQLLQLEINHVTKQPTANCLNKCRPPSRHSKGQKLNSYKQLANLARTYFMLKVLTLIRKKCPGLCFEPHPKLLGFHEISYIPTFPYFVSKKKIFLLNWFNFHRRHKKIEL